MYLCVVVKLKIYIFKGNHGTNIKRQLIRHHKFKENDFIEDSTSKCKQNKIILKRNQKDNQHKINEMNSIQLQVTKTDLENNCVES